MAVFCAYQPFLRILTIYDLENFQHQQRNILIRNICQAIAVTLFAVSFIIAIVCMLWFCLHHNFDLAKVALSFGILVNALQFVAAHISIRMKSDLVDRVITCIDQIVIKRCELSPDRVQHYEHLEKRLARITSIGVQFSVYVTGSFFGASFMVPISYAVFGYPQPNHWAPMFQYYVPLPNGTNVVLQYYVDWIDQSMFCITYYMTVCTVALFFIGICIYIGGMVEDLRLNLAKFDGHPDTMTRRLFAEIEFHNELLAIAKSVGDIMSTALFFQLLVCAASLAVYMVGIESNGYLSLSSIISIIGLVDNILSTYAYCYLSEYVTFNLAIVGGYFYNCPWYRLRVKQHKLILLSIQRAQLEFRINGLGIVECSLRTFSSIVRAAWSYFLVMHS